MFATVSSHNHVYHRGDGARRAETGGFVFAEGEFELTLNGETGRIYLIQASTDLVVWEPVTNVLSTASTLQIVDPTVTRMKQRFYRVFSP